jgi:hypothetical protein
VVTRQEIFDRVWADVVVSDGALSQAIRTIRRSLGDDPRDPRFIRTVSRHGYQFVALDVIEDADEGPIGGRAPAGDDAPAVEVVHAVEARDRFEHLMSRLLGEGPHSQLTNEERREAAEELHALGTERALRALDGRPGHAAARAILRDARWDVPGAGHVQLLGAPSPVASIAHLVRLRLRLALKETSNRWTAAALGGTAAGLLAGLIGGLALWGVTGSNASQQAVLALAIVGAAAGALGTAGIGAGLAAAEAVARSSRTLALSACGAAGGFIAGVAGNAVMRAFASGIFGRELPEVGGWLEGVVLGAASGLGYAWSTSLMPGGGLAAPRGAARLRVALVTGGVSALAAVALTIGGGHFVASSLDALASQFEGSAVGLAPLARTLGEGSLRPLTKTLASAFEGLLFGAGLALGLTHRPKRQG